MSKENDYGFTFADEEELFTPEKEKTQKAYEEIKNLKIRLITLEKMMLPFLENLSKEPQKPMIKWPNRKNVLDDQIKKMLQLTRV